MRQRAGPRPGDSTTFLVDVHVEVSHDPIGSLRPVWEGLYASDPRATPFLAHGFADAWLRHWADGVTPRVVTVHDAGAPVGLAPLVLRRRRSER